MKRKISFNFRISRIANFYFFVQNLSEWHSSNNKESNKSWREKLKFSKEEDKLIKKFKDIQERYPFYSDHYLGNYFLFFQKTINWNVVKENIEHSDFLELKKIFNKLEPKFDLIWKEELKKLKAWEKILEKIIYLKESKKIEDILENFYNWKIKKSIKIDVILLISTGNYSGGSVNFIKDKPHILLLEISNQGQGRWYHVLMVLWHELSHILIFKNSNILNIIEMFIRKNDKKIKKIFSEEKIKVKDIKSYINEIILSSFLPNGFIRQLLFKIECSFGKNKFQQKVLEATEYNIEKKISFSENYLKKIIE